MARTLSPPEKIDLLLGLPRPGSTVRMCEPGRVYTVRGAHVAANGDQFLTVEDCTTGDVAADIPAHWFELAADD